MFIKYNQEVSTKEIKRRNKIDLGAWDSKVGIIDDFSALYYNTKVFYADRPVTNDKNVKALLWDYGTVMEVWGFPFDYSKVKISTLTDDSTLVVMYDNKKKYVPYNTEMCDSIIEFEKNGKIFTCTKTVFTIENIGYVKQENIFYTFNGENRDVYSLTSKLYMNEFCSRYSGGCDSLYAFFSNNLCDTLNETGRVVLNVTINCTGKIKNISVMQGVNPVLIKEATRVINLVKWLPSSFPKDFTFSVPFNFQ